MKKNGKKNTLLLLVSLAVVLSLTSFILSLLPYDSIATIHGWATQNTATLSVTITSEETNLTVPSSGIIIPPNTYIRERVINVTGLTPGWIVNVTLFGKGFPSSWSESQPNSSQAGNNTIEYFEININASTAGGSYRVYFNVTSSQLAGVQPNNISLFVFNSTWKNLSTTVVDGNTDPRQFYGVTTHFSKFLVAERPAGSGQGSGGEEEAGPSGSPGSGGGGGGGSSRRKSTEPTPPSEEVLEEVEEKLPEPVHKPGILFDVSVNIPNEYRKVLPGQELVAEIHAINVKSIGSVAVKVEYTIGDKEGEVLFQEVETKVIENEIKYLKAVQLTKDIPPGAYMFFAKVRYENDTALAGYPFEVMKDEKPLFGFAVPLLTYTKVFKDYGMYLVGLVILVLVLLGIIHFAKRKRIPRLVFIRGKD